MIATKNTGSANVLVSIENPSNLTLDTPDTNVNEHFEELYSDIVNSYKEKEIEVKTEIIRRLTHGKSSSPIFKSFFDKRNAVPSPEFTMGQCDSPRSSLRVQVSKEKREWILSEIISSEKTYVESLKKLNNWFAEPLLHDKIISEESWKLLFQHLELLLSINEPFLKDLEEFLQEKLEKGLSSQNVAQIFLNTANSFRSYSNYINNYNIALHELKELRKTSTFKNWDDNQSQEMFKANMRTNTVQSLLILPVQRIPRYALMLDDLYKETTEQHPEFDTVKLAAIEMKQIAIYCDKSKSEQESNLEKLQNLQATLKIKDLVQPTRQYIKEGNLKLSGTPCEVYLLSDMLVIVIQSFLKKTVTIDLKDPIVSIYNSVDEFEDFIDSAFIIETYRQQFWFGCNNSTQRDSWVQDIIKQKVKEGIDEVVKKGWLIKSAEKENTFLKKRYHIQTTTKMKYYEKPKGAFKGAYLLDGSAVRVNQRNKPVGFDIVTPKRTYYLRAEDEDDRDAWIKSLSKCKNVRLEK